MILYRLVIADWTVLDPAHRVYPVFERDNFRCMVPGCSARGNLHDHHIDFKSHGGSNELFNRLSLCWLHHRMLHDGVISVVGRADGVLFWRVGRSNPRYYCGVVRLPFIAGAPKAARRRHADDTRGAGAHSRGRRGLPHRGPKRADDSRGKRLTAAV